MRSPSQVDWLTRGFTVTTAVRRSECSTIPPSSFSGTVCHLAKWSSAWAKELGLAFTAFPEAAWALPLHGRAQGGGGTLMEMSKDFLQSIPTLG